MYFLTVPQLEFFNAFYSRPGQKPHFYTYSIDFEVQEIKIELEYNPNEVEMRFYYLM